jgi:phage terminase large subunit-like protein
MVRNSPDLQELVRIVRFNLSVERTSSAFEPLSSDEKTLDGLNPHCVLLDEVHKHKNRALLDVLDTALGARRQPLLWMITTAGDDDPESVYAHENDYAIQVLERTIEDDTLFAYIATIDEGDRWDDPLAWAKANPNLGISVKLDDLKRQADKAAKSPTALVAFKRLRLNVRTAAANKFIPADLWAKNTDGPFDPEHLRGRRCFGGLDLASKVDIAAWIKLFPPIDGEKRWKVVGRFWMPHDTIMDKTDRDKVQYQAWVDQGLIEPTLGNVIDHAEIQAAVLEDARQYQIEALAFDPWNAQQMASALGDEGLNLVEFVQGIKSYTAPTKELEAMLLADSIDHGGNPVLRWMAANLAVQKDKNENLMPTKKISTGRIDGMTGLIMAIGMAMHEAGDASIYNTRGPLIIGG